MQQDLVRRGRLAALGGELQVRREMLRLALLAPLRLDQDPDAGRRVEPDDDLVGLRAAALHAEPELRRTAGHEPQLSLRDRQALAGADEERHARPAPVLDLP